ncbi:MAG: hypothetical protein WAV28_06325 [Sedimentisphaerales bacterium]|jgi:hypothetical protein
MADYDSNIIKPVEGLQSITGLTPAKQREERKRRQELHQENEEKEEFPEGELNESVDEAAQGPDNSDQGWTENRSDRNSDGTGVDYCA